MMNMSTTNEQSGSELLRKEISRVGAGMSGQAEDRYLLDVGAEHIVTHLRQAVKNGSEISPTLKLLLRLNDETVALAVAGLRDSAAKRGEALPEEARLADALAESYLDNHNMFIMLSAATRHLQALVRRLESRGVTAESDPACRTAFAIVTAFDLWRDEPENPAVNTLINELEEQIKMVVPSQSKAAPADRAAKEQTDEAG